LLTVSRAKAVKEGVASPRSLYRRFAEATYNQSNFLLETAFTAGYVGKASGHYFGRVNKKVITPKVAWGTYKF